MQNPSRRSQSLVTSLITSLSYFLGFKERPEVTRSHEAANALDKQIAEQRETMISNLREVEQGSKNLILMASMLEIKANGHKAMPIANARKPKGIN